MQHQPLPDGDLPPPRAPRGCPSVDAIYGALRRAGEGRRPGRGAAVPTALVDEAWRRLSSESGGHGRHRSQFLGMASLAMRRILLQEARGQRAAGEHDPLPALSVPPGPTSLEARAEELIALDAALERLELRHPSWVRIVELRTFAGLSLAEVAEVLGRPTREVEARWLAARDWLEGQGAGALT